ncbi:MAG: MSEP-CTERM sorting domain-containing protein [Nonlabens sp.]
MKKLLHPVSNFLLNVTPLLVLFILAYNSYQIFEPILKENNRNLWNTYGWILFLLTVLQIIYSAFLLLSKRKLTLVWAMINLIIYISFLAFFLDDLNKLYPSSIPDWMISFEEQFYVLTFLMPTLVHALMVGVIRLTPSNKIHRALPNLGFAAVIPLLFYVASQVAIPFISGKGSFFDEHVILVVVISATVLFLFFLVRASFILIRRNSDRMKSSALWWKIPFTILLPLLGLAVNNGVTGFTTFGFNKLFGDFSSPWFYLLAFLNGVLLCLPQKEHIIYRVVLFLGRCLTFAFTTYFMVVFLPFLPFSVFAIIAFGAGILLLTPLIMFVVHIDTLYRDVKYLTMQVKAIKVYGLAVLAVLTIPAIITTNFYLSRSTLLETMEYVFLPDYDKNYNINTERLDEVLVEIEDNRPDNNRWSIYGNKTPYISSLYTNIVLDNLTVSRSKTEKIRSIFYGTPSNQSRSNDRIKSNDVRITDVNVHSIYDENKGYWRSQIDLELTNESTTSRLQEYRTNFTLEPGNYISDYYLNVNGIKKHGLLAEKKSALWVYNNITRVRQDPGILYYTDVNSVQFNVYPVNTDQSRETGFEIIHKNPTSITIDDRTLNLGYANGKKKEIFESGDAIFIPSPLSRNLNSKTIKNEFHFIIDATNNDHLEEFRNDVKTLIEKNNLKRDQIYLHLTAANSKEVSLENDWHNMIESSVASQSFYAEHVIKRETARNYLIKNPNSLKFILITEQPESVLINSLEDWNFALNIDEDLLIEKNGKMYHYNWFKHQIDDQNIRLKNTSKKLIYEDQHKNRYLINGVDKSLVLPLKEITTVSRISTNTWESGTAMNAAYLHQLLNHSNYQEQWLSIIKQSFETGVLSHFTSYMVVENKAQENALLKKQEEVLNGNRLLDTEDEPRRMSEPSLLITILLLAGWLIYRKENETA